MTVGIKICGLKTIEAVQAASAADYLGFVFFPASPRNISPEHAGILKPYAATAKTVAVTVDPDDALLAQIIRVFTPDYIQLHGNESPERVEKIKNRFQIPIIKAFRIHDETDLANINAYEGITNMLLFDAKPTAGLPGGTGKTFDWNLLSGRRFAKPYFLSGGINAGNVEEALRFTGASLVDVSSGVETSPGVKSSELIQDFIKRTRSL